MRQPAPDLAALIRPALAGCAVSVIEMLMLADAGHRAGSDIGEWSAVAFVSFGMCAALALMTWAATSATARVARTPTMRTLAVMVCVCVAVVAAGISLTTGRTASASALRWPAVLGGGIAAAVAAAVGLRVLVAWRARGHGLRWAAALWMVAAALGCLAADRMLLPRLYPAFHWGGAGVAWVLVFLAAWVAPWRALGVRVGALWFAGACLALVAWPSALMGRLPAGSVHLLEAHAPFSGKWLAMARRVRAGGANEARGRPGRAAHNSAATPARPAATPALDLLGYDVLLVTVDALRYDRVSEGRHHAIAPNLAALAARGATFDRAYTSTPHTSYAIASLMTGKHLRTALSARPGAEHRSWAQLLAGAGYATAAFYPPAVFYVDGEQLASLAENGLGFGHREVAFVPAAERARAVMSHVAGVPRDRRVFVWAHFFEPHEPYDAPSPELEAAPPLARYDAEVAAVDAVIGPLVAAFERARPRALIVVTSDHGEEFGEHGGAYHGTTVFDEQVRVPLVVVAGGRIAPRRIGAPVETIDLAPTFSLALGVPPDARMAGRDLGPLLVSVSDSARVAMSVAGDEWMVTDGTHKAVCTTGVRGCRLFDLRADPREQDDVATDEPEVATRLERQLGERIDAMIARERDDGGDAALRVLSRARLLDPTVTPELVPLLGASDSRVRSESARLLGEQRYEPALPALVRMRTEDPDADVRVEAAIASLGLGDHQAVPQVGAAYLLASGAVGDSGDRARRSALALALADDGRGVATLVAWASAPGVLEARRRALRAAAPHATSREVPALAELLSDPSLRIEAALALGHAGGRPARRAILDALERETYPLARMAELLALGRIDGGACRRLVWPIVEAGAVPERVAALLACGSLARPGPAGLVVATAAEARRGEWQCDGHGCAPRAEAELVWPRAPSRTGARPGARLFVRVHAARADELVVNGIRTALRAGASELELDPAPLLVFQPAPGVRIEAAAVVRQAARPPAAPAASPASATTR